LASSVRPFLREERQPKRWANISVFLRHPLEPSRQGLWAYEVIVV